MANESGKAGAVSWAWMPGWTLAEREAWIRAFAREALPRPTFLEWLEEARRVDPLLAASSVDLDNITGTIAVTVPAGTSAEEIEALRARMDPHVPWSATLKIWTAPVPCGVPGCYCRTPGGWPRALLCEACRDRPEYSGATVRTSWCVCGPSAAAMFAVLDDPPPTPRLRHDPVAEAAETRRCLERADDFHYQAFLEQRAAQAVAQALFGWLS